MSVCEEVANAFLTMTSDDFDKWLVDKVIEIGGDYTFCRSGYLQGALDESWAREYASIKATP